jgi:hypothetical protein
VVLAFGPVGAEGLPSDENYKLKAICRGVFIKLGFTTADENDAVERVINPFYNIYFQGSRQLCHLNHTC